MSSNININTMNKNKKQTTCCDATPEPDFRTNPSGWIGWNMETYCNDFETAKTLLSQRLWLMRF
jgi:hypothetical protein